MTACWVCLSITIAGKSVFKNAPPSLDRLYHAKTGGKCTNFRRLQIQFIVEEVQNEITIFQQHLSHSVAGEAS